MRVAFYLIHPPDINSHGHIFDAYLGTKNARITANSLHFLRVSAQMHNLDKQKTAQIRYTLAGMVKQTSMYIIFFPLIIFLLTSCNGLTEKHFLTSDNTTGGFLDISLDLNKDNTLVLLKIDQKVVSHNDAGSTYIPDTTVLVSGKWTSSKGKIYCEINETQKFVTDAFLKSNFKTKDININDNKISFPLSADTLYIYGQPCVATKTTTR